MKYSDNKYLCRLTATSYNPLATFITVKRRKQWEYSKQYLMNYLEAKKRTK